MLSERHPQVAEGAPPTCRNATHIIGLLYPEASGRFQPSSTTVSRKKLR